MRHEMGGRQSNSVGALHFAGNSETSGYGNNAQIHQQQIPTSNSIPQYGVINLRILKQIMLFLFRCSKELTVYSS